MIKPIYGNGTRVEHIIYPLPLKYGDRFGADIRTGRRKRKKARGRKKEKDGKFCEGRKSMVDAWSLPDVHLPFSTKVLHTNKDRFRLARLWFRWKLQSCTESADTRGKKKYIYVHSREFHQRPRPPVDRILSKQLLLESLVIGPSFLASSDGIKYTNKRTIFRSENFAICKAIEMVS